MVSNIVRFGYVRQYQIKF